VQNFHIRKAVNAFIPNATPSLALPDQALRQATRFSRKWGGLWVGGSVDMSPEGIAFTPNALNRAFHVDLESIRIASQDIRSVRCEFGWLTGVVVVSHTSGEFRFRCYGAKRLVATLADNYCAH